MNMRLTVGSQMTNTLEIQKFVDWLLDIGEGNLGGPNDGEATISILDDLLIKHSLDPMSDLIDFVYPSMLERFNDLTYFQERALLAHLNEVVQEINDRMLSYFPGQEMEYLSSDSIDEVERVLEDFDPTLYSPDFLNGIKMSGMPNHRLLLKVGVPIMLLRNINQKKGLCNGTRLQVVSLGKRVIEAKVVSVVIKYVNGQQKTVKPKTILQSDDLFLLRDLDELKLSNERKHRAHFDLEEEFKVVMAVLFCWWIVDEYDVWF
ncbi:uncharacterized protein LOC143540898 [Bidens hawaiensis]|uniref:uncharacterized protein LOC143540898 n=1 Tax=Bidens hawaiensis TaxID=980011 RepID=UPI0040499506